MQDLDLNKNDSDIDNENEINMTETQELEPINLAPVASEPALAETSTPNEPSAFSNNYAEIKIEAAAIREWREQNDKRIQEADEKEHEAKQQMLADARRELEEWKQSRNDNLEKTKIRNREVSNCKQSVLELWMHPGRSKKWEILSIILTINAKKNNFRWSFEI